MDVLGKRSYDGSNNAASSYSNQSSYGGGGGGGGAGGGGGYHDAKRPRPEEILGEGYQAVTRVLMDRYVFAKVIGKGGTMISSIRQACGVQMKGLDIDPDNRLIVISGSLRQVLEAFEKVTDLLNTAYCQQPQQTEPFMVHLLIEHSRAGKVIGPKGATMQDMKVRSGSTQVRVQKDPKEFSGMLMRVVTMEGSPLAVKKAHFCFQELFLPDAAHMLAMSEASSSGGGGGGGGGVGGGGGRVGGPPPPFSHEDVQADMPLYAGGGGGGAASSSTSHSQRARGGSSGVVAIPLNTLASHGVPTEVVDTLSELKSLFASQFGLDLAVTKLGPASFSAGMGMGPDSSLSSGAGAGRGSGVPHNELLSTPGEAVEYDDMIAFSIPKNAAGMVIGKGGEVLKGMQSDFNVRVFVEKEGDVPGMRVVVLKSGSTMDQALTDADRAAMKQCQDQIMAIVAREQEKETMHQQQQQQQLPQGDSNFVVNTSLHAATSAIGGSHHEGADTVT